MLQARQLGVRIPGVLAPPRALYTVRAGDTGGMRLYNMLLGHVGAVYCCLCDRSRGTSNPNPSPNPNPNPSPNPNSNPNPNPSPNPKPTPNQGDVPGHACGPRASAATGPRRAGFLCHRVQPWLGSGLGLGLGLG